MSEFKPEHTSVLLDEVIGFLEIDGDSVVIDATLGLGGHAEAILERFDNSQVIGIDQDERALAAASERLRRFGNRFVGVHSNFSAMAKVAADNGLESVDAIIADLGVSSMQLDDPERGFSFRFDAPLDMRMDTTSGKTAAELLEELDEEEVANLIYKYGEERKSRRVARLIIERRQKGQSVQTTAELAKLVEKAVGRSPK